MSPGRYLGTGGFVKTFRNLELGDCDDVGLVVDGGGEDVIGEIRGTAPETLPDLAREDGVGDNCGRIKGRL